MRKRSFSVLSQLVATPMLQLMSGVGKDDVVGETGHSEAVIDGRRCKLTPHAPGDVLPPKAGLVQGGDGRFYRAEPLA